MSELGCADGCVGAREWVEMGRKKEPLGMSELGGRRGCNRVGGNGWGEGAAGDERAWMRTAADGVAQGNGWKWVGKKLLGMSERGCAKRCGRRGCKGVGGNREGEGGVGNERAWMRGDGVGTREWVEMGREKEPLEMSELRWLRTAWV
eukprot:s3212_g4.t1